MSDVTEHRLNALENAVSEINASIKSIDQSMQVMARVEVNQQHMLSTLHDVGKDTKRNSERIATHDEKLISLGRVVWGAVLAGISGVVAAIIQAI
jgi:ABC-type nitrate/sulfonate/bicarbonate transport system permease component